MKKTETKAVEFENIGELSTDEIIDRIVCATRPDVDRVVKLAPGIISSGGCVGVPLYGLLDVFESVFKSLDMSIDKLFEEDGTDRKELEELVASNPMAIAFVYFRGRFHIALQGDMCEPERISALFPDASFVAPAASEIAFEPVPQVFFSGFDDEGFEEGEVFAAVIDEDSEKFEEFLSANGYSIMTEFPDEEKEFRFYSVFAEKKVIVAGISAEELESSTYILDNVVLIDFLDELTA